MCLSDSYRLYGVLSERIDKVWHDAKKMLIKALEHAQNKYSIESVYNAIKNRDMQLWLVYNNSGLQGVVVTEIINFPLTKILSIAFLAGIDFDKWAHNWSDIRLWAIENGCSRVRIFGRPGWEKKLKRLGFEKTQIVLETQI